MRPKQPDPVDRHVGSRIRMRRVILKMSQVTLAEHIGLTFQQVQKYEKGRNRVGAGRMQKICEALDIPVSFLFEGLPGAQGLGQAVPQWLVDFMTTVEGRRIVEALTKIPESDIRRHLADLAESIAARGPLPPAPMGK